MSLLARVIYTVIDLVFPPKHTDRIVRAVSPLEFGRLLSPHLLASGTVALLPYRHRAVRAAILETKFHANARARTLLADALTNYLTSLADESAGFEHSRYVIVPVPLGTTRRKERGYNQVEEVAQKTSIPVNTGLLVRTRDTQPQTTLSRASRLTNVKDAFAGCGPFDEETTYIVLDDVVTTGATLNAAGTALKEAGARRVLPVALAH